MVRIKQRYILVNILYPQDLCTPKQTQKNLPDALVLHQPVRGSMSEGALARAIKQEMRSLFGDYGSGTVERTLQGESSPPPPIVPTFTERAPTNRQGNNYSEVPLLCHIHLHPTRLEVRLSPGVDGPHLYALPAG